MIYDKYLEQWDWFNIIASAVALLFVTGIVWGGYAIHSQQTAPRATPIYHNGQMVKMRAFDQVGMVVGNLCWKISHGGGCRYSVRFSAMQLKTDTRLLGSDGPISFSPVALVHGIREYELEAAR